MGIDSSQEHNIAVAEHLYRQIEHMNQFDIPGLTSWSRSAGQLCDEILLSAPRPSGGLNVLLADFIGQGLTSAVGALPVAEVFFEMTAKGYGLSDIVEEMNNKVLFVLPKNLFCAACLIELDQDGKLLAVWNSGEDLLVIGSDGNIKNRVSSSQSPLGKHLFTKADLDTSFIDITPGDRVLLYTDGLLSCFNKLGEPLGKEQFEALVSTNNSFSEIIDALLAYMDGELQTEDMTLVQLDVSEIHQHDVTALTDSQQGSLAPAQWQVDFNFSAQVLKNVNIVPLVVEMLMSIQAPREHRQRIYTVIAEMCSNAIDHGLLKLDSGLKASGNGFTEYYLLRDRRLAALTDGYINVSLQHEKNEQGGKLIIVVKDSGEGFDYLQHAKKLVVDSSLYGRGEALLKQLCHSYHFSDRGNIITAEYHW